MLPTKFRFIWPSGFRGEDFFKSANQKQELPVAAMLISVHLAEGFQRRRLKCEKLTDDRRRTPSDGNWQGELKNREHSIFWHLVTSYLDPIRAVTHQPLFCTKGSLC